MPADRGRRAMQLSEGGRRCVLSPLRICIEEIKPSSVLLAVVSSAMNRPKESALRLSDCTELCVIVEGADDCLHCYWTAKAGHSRHAIFM